MAKKVHRDLCRKHGIEHSDEWYEHTPEGVVENEAVKILWDINVQCDNVIQARRLDVIVIHKEKNKALIVEIAVPADTRIVEKELEKVEKYQDLKKEIKRLWELRCALGSNKAVVIGALGSVTKDLECWIENIDIVPEVGVLQKTALLGTARILRKVLEL